MDLTIIICAVVLIAIIIAVAVIVKKLIKIILISSAVIIIALLVTGFLAYRDITDWREKFEISENIFLLENNQEIIAGISMENENEPEFFKTDKINQYNEFYKEKKFREILENRYKLFIFKIDVFDSIEKVEIINETYSYDFVKQMLESDNPVDLFVEDKPDMIKQEIKKQISDETEFKSKIFALLFKEETDKYSGPFFIFKEFKKGRIIIYKETIALKLVKVIPLSFIKKSIEKTTAGIHAQVVKFIGD